VEPAALVKEGETDASSSVTYKVSRSWNSTSITKSPNRSASNRKPKSICMVAERNIGSVAIDGISATSILGGGAAMAASAWILCAVIARISI